MITDSDGKEPHAPASEDILGYPVTVQDCQQVIHDCVDWVRVGTRPKFVACLNPHSAMVAEKDDLFHTALTHADLLVPDGIGIVLASRVMHGRLRTRITGSDLFSGLCRRLNDLGDGYSVYFLGSTEPTLAAISARLKQEYPNLRLAGTYSPPFKAEFDAEDNRRMVEAINETRPDVLWVGMTAPKQEKWIFQNREHLKAKILCAVGAVFDFYTGRIKRSSPVFQRLGLEWLPRLLQEPRRLWRRNLNSPLFLLRTIQWSMAQRQGR